MARERPTIVVILLAVEDTTRRHPWLALVCTTAGAALGAVLFTLSLVHVL